MHRVPPFRLFTLAVVVPLLGACSSAAAPPVASVAGATSAPAASASANSAPRPSSPAVLELVSPTAGETITGATVHVAVTLSGAHIVQATTTNVRPDEGHVHLYLDGTLVYMNYGLTQDLPVQPGTHAIHAEFVAADHVPFNPRVVTPDVVFSVK